MTAPYPIVQPCSSCGRPIVINSKRHSGLCHNCLRRDRARRLRERQRNEVDLPNLNQDCRVCPVIERCRREALWTVKAEPGVVKIRRLLCEATHLGEWFVMEKIKPGERGTPLASGQGD
jgi:hypothetical protein